VQKICRFGADDSMPVDSGVQDLRILKPIAHPMDCFDEVFWGSQDAEFLAQAAHVGGDGLLGGTVFEGPDLLDDARSAQNPAATAGQQL
jgi:hypothetical protein